MITEEEGQFLDADEKKLFIEKTTKKVKFQLADKCCNLAIYKEVVSSDNEQDSARESDYYSEDMEEEYDEYYDVVFVNEGPANHVLKKDGLNTQTPSTKVSNYQPMRNINQKNLAKINLEPYEGPRLPHRVANKVIETQKKVDAERYRVKDKCDRAVVEQVLDRPTMAIFNKLLNKDLGEINGSISTGKEAIVYYATSQDDITKEYVIKVFKNVVMDFKNRQKYIDGDYRFQTAYRSNKRDMILAWAEKEMRNLLRMHAVGLPVPKPFILKQNVLVMDFIGHNRIPAPKLKDVDLSQGKACKLYRECVSMMWTMYNKCKLVHADLSEYNMLYHQGQLYLIDVSQSVEHDHPHALEFLRIDCKNINGYFKKKEVATMTVEDLFNFITDPTINEKNMEACLDKLSELAATRTLEPTEEEKLAEEVFKHVFIAPTLTDVKNCERDISQVKEGNPDHNIYYRSITGLNDDLTPRIKPALLTDEESCESSDEDDHEPSNFVNSARPRDESPSSKKARKKAVKNQQAEKRKTKTPKHVKKRHEKNKKGK